MTIPLVDLHTYRTMTRPHMEWLVKGLIPRPGYIFLTGEPKCGKSYLALQLALCIAQGMPFLGHSTPAVPQVGHVSSGPNLHPPHSPRTVLYLQLDTSEMVWRERLEGLQDQLVDISGPVYMPHPDSVPGRVNVLDQSSRDWLQALITAADPALVVIDILRQIHNADEDSSTEMKTVFDELDILLQGRSCLFLHHAPKLHPEFGPIRVVNSLRGSSYMAGHADAIWLLNDGYLHVESRFGSSDRIWVQRRKSGLFERKS